MLDSGVEMRAGLYAIADADACRRAGCALEETALALIEAGPVALQLRWKGAEAGAFLAVCRRVLAAGRARGVPVIVNDRVDLARLVGADGVHLGQDDLPLEAARALLPAGTLVGISTHDASQVEAALAAGADYLGFGPVFPTDSKEVLDPLVGLAGLRAAVRIAAGTPVVAIGGISRARLKDVREAGARAVAVISDLLQEGTGAQAIEIRASQLDRAFQEAGQ